MPRCHAALYRRKMPQALKSFLTQQEAHICSGDRGVELEAFASDGTLVGPFKKDAAWDRALSYQ